MLDVPSELPSTNSHPKLFQFHVRHLLEGMAWLAVLLAIVVNTYRETEAAIVFAIVWSTALLVSLYARDAIRGTTLCIAWAGLAITSCLLLPALVPPRVNYRSVACINNLKQIGLAMEGYEDAYGSLPPAYIVDANGKPMHSWRVLILPFCEGAAIYKQYKFSEPWDGPNNKKLHNLTISPYCCPSSTKPTDTSYLAVVGPGTVWPGAQATNTKMVTDDPASTIMLVEVANSGIHWMEPRDLPISATSAGVNPQTALGISASHGERANALLRDGSTGRLDSRTPAEVLQALLTINGGEMLNKDSNGDWSLAPPAIVPQAATPSP